MIWGGEEAVLQVRSLPFPHWARLAVFGPRISVAAMDRDSWSNPQQRKSWCKRIARDVWQFDQQACSSPQTLFLEKKPGHSTWEFVQALREAFESENRLHPRENIHASLTTAICQARASWLLDNVANRAAFPQSPDWTILLGSGSEIPRPTQGKTLTVLEVDDLWTQFQSSTETYKLSGWPWRMRRPRQSSLRWRREEAWTGSLSSDACTSFFRPGMASILSGPWFGWSGMLAQRVECIPKEPQNYARCEGLLKSLETNAQDVCSLRPRNRTTRMRVCE